MPNRSTGFGGRYRDAHHCKCSVSGPADRAQTLCLVGCKSFARCSRRPGDQGTHPGREDLASAWAGRIRSQRRPHGVQWRSRLVGRHSASGHSCHSDGGLGLRRDARRGLGALFHRAAQQPGRGLCLGSAGGLRVRRADWPRTARTRATACLSAAA